MKKLLSVLMLSVMLLAFASAIDPTHVEDTSGVTIIAGKIYNADYTATIADATVIVTCDGNIIQNVSQSDGAYSVKYDESDCQEGSTLSVYAEKDGLSNTMTGEIHNNYPVPEWNLNLGVVNVPLVPEFGKLAIIFTALGAVGVFFVVRRK